jgi:protein gp37
MSDNTGIEWTDATWNPVTGCTEVSPGCDHCYAKTFAERWRGTPGHYFENGFDVQLRPDKLEQPLRWKKPRKIFVNSMSDLFHDQIPDEYIVEVFAVMAAARQHTFQVLTKRHARMRSLVSSEKFWADVDHWACGQHGVIDMPWPLPNVWLGVSAENQQWAGIRIPALLETRSAVRFVSAEPLLGPIDFTYWLNGGFGQVSPADIDWVIVGGESGRGARPMHPDWPRDIRDACHASGTAFLFKQWGEYGLVSYLHEGTGRALDAGQVTPFPANSSGFIPVMRKVGKHKAGRMLGGRTWDQYPEAAAS